MASIEWARLARAAGERDVTVKSQLGAAATPPRLIAGQDAPSHDEAASWAMPPHRDADRRFNLVYSTIFIGLTALGLMPIWITDILPLLDAASHQHLIRIMHDYGHEAMLQRHYQEVHAIVPYLTYYKAVDWLMAFMNVELANRIVLSLCLAALPLAASSLLRALDHNRWLILGVFPWMLNSDFFMGFFSYLMSIPVFLWLLAAHLRFLRRPTWRGAAMVAGLGVFLALTHYLLWAVMLVLLPTLALVFGARNQRLRGIVWMVREVGVVMPSVLVLLPWFLSYFVLAEDARTPDQAAIGSANIAQRLSRLYSGQHLGPIDNLNQLFSRIFDNFAPHGEYISSGAELFVRRQGEVASFLWLVAMALWLMGAVKRHRVVVAKRANAAQARAAIVGDGDDGDHGATPDSGAGFGGRARAFVEISRVYGGVDGVRSTIHGTSYAGWVLAMMTAAYFVLPQHLARPIYLYGVNFRLIEVIGVLAVVALPVCPIIPPNHVRMRVWLGTALMTIVAVVVPLHTAGVFMLVRTEYGSIRQAFGTIPANRSVLTLRMKRESNWLREKIFSNIGEYYGVFQGGYVPYSFADSSSKPIITRKELSKPAPTWFDHTTFGMDIHGRYYDYIVIYRNLGERPGTWEHNLQTWHRVYQRDHWQVFRNPTPQPWPPPTPAELARSAAMDRATQWLLERSGLAPEGSLPDEFGAFLDLLRVAAGLEAEGIDADTSSGSAAVRHRKRRRLPDRPERPARPEPQAQPQAAPPAPPAPTPAPAEPINPSETRRSQGGDEPPEASALMPMLPARLPVFPRGLRDIGPIFGRGATPDLDTDAKARPRPDVDAGGRPARGDDMGPTPPTPATGTSWFDLQRFGSQTAPTLPQP